MQGEPPGVLASFLLLQLGLGNRRGPVSALSMSLEVSSPPYEVTSKSAVGVLILWGCRWPCSKCLQHPLLPARIPVTGPGV